MPGATPMPQAGPPAAPPAQAGPAPAPQAPPSPTPQARPAAAPAAGPQGAPAGGTDPSTGINWQETGAAYKAFQKLGEDQLKATIQRMTQEASKGGKKPDPLTIMKAAEDEIAANDAMNPMLKQVMLAQMADSKAKWNFLQGMGVAGIRADAQVETGAGHDAASITRTGMQQSGATQRTGMQQQGATQREGMRDSTSERNTDARDSTSERNTDARDATSTTNTNTRAAAGDRATAARSKNVLDRTRLAALLKKYPTPDTVAKAYKAGSLSRDQAATILRQAGWAQ